ncbi:MAG: type IV toxin-antitoxin system AbiEi family antitoxin domain-containing protein [Deltaproteobacteria bacterium]|nr:type IV toxin-antitoxin system AbiEi family antitoxin domain-containing protein [Deltaproteobacteria bacterium]
MNLRSESRSSGTYGVQLLRALAEDGRQVFSTKEAAETAKRIGVSGNYLKLLLAFLLRDGWVMRLRRGLYVRSGTAPGDIQVHPFTVATRLVAPSAISHWSALSYFGMTEQVPETVTAFTPKKTYPPSMRVNQKREVRRRHGWIIEGVRYEFVTVKREYYFGIEQVWVDEYSRIPVTDRERTILETFISPWTFGGLGEALGIVEAHIHRLDTGKLVAYAVRYGKIAVAKRLGWVLEKAGVERPILDPLLKIPARGYHALDPNRPHRGACDKRWMIQNNL